MLLSWGMRSHGAIAAMALACGLVASEAARAEPEEYVRVCDAYGSGFFYIPGTETCLRIGGPVRPDPGASRLRTSESNPPQPRARSFIQTNSFSLALEGGWLSGETNLNLNGTFGPAVSGSGSDSFGLFGLDARLPIGGPLSTMGRGPFIGSVTTGIRIQTHFGADGTTQFSIHPAPSLPTVVGFEREWSINPYIGLPIIFPIASSGGRGAAIVATPWMGVNFESGNLHTTTFEFANRSGFEDSITRTGFNLGLDLDWYCADDSSLNGQWFFGLGVFANFMPSESMTGQSPLFTYNTHLESSTDVGFKVRAGYVFGPGLGRPLF